MSFVFVLQLGRIRPKSAKRRTTVKRINNARNRYARLLYHFSSFFFIGHPALFSRRPWFTPDIVFIYHICPYPSTLFPVSLPSIDKGKHGFSGLKQRSASFSSLPGVSPAASSASLTIASAPEKLRRTFRRAMMGSGEEEDDGGLTPTEDDDDVQCLSGPPESGSALVNRG